MDDKQCHSCYKGIVSDGENILETCGCCDGNYQDCKTCQEENLDD